VIAGGAVALDAVLGTAFTATVLAWIGVAVYNSDAAPTKPEGIPEDWVEKPADTSGGTQWVNPNNPNDRVSVMPGNPDSPYPHQQGPYVVDQKGGFSDVNGNTISAERSGATPEAHIPYDDFKFRR
jgi:hypothetical protein